MSSQNEQAIAFTRLHVPGQPIVLLNVWDAVSARAVAQAPSCKAIATPSAGIANAIGLSDDDLVLEANLRAISAISKVAKELNKPLTVDMQDCYGDQLEEAIAAIISLGAVGLNIEDCNKEKSEMFSAEEAEQRVRRVRAAAQKNGVPNLHINARCDTFVRGGSLEEVIERGRAYLAAGASTVFVWGGPKRGLTREEIQQLVEAFDGKLNVSMRFTPGSFGIKELSDLGVARISVGPGLLNRAMQYVGEEAERIFQSV